MKPALWLILSSALLFSLGLLMIFNTTAAEIIDRSLPTSTHAGLLRQLLYGCFGVVAGLIVYWKGHRYWLAWSGPLAILCTILLAMVFVPWLGQSVNGSRRWISLAGSTFQPSECAKILLPLSFIQWVIVQGTPIRWNSFARILMVFALPVGLIFLEPDTGSTVIIGLTFLTLFILSRISWVYWMVPLCLFCGVVALAASQMPHVRDRIRVYLHPESDLRGKGHQPYQAKIAAGSGRFLGRGLGESLQKLNYLPEARSDYIAAIYAEECGFVGICGLIALYLALAYSGIAIAMHTKERSAFLLAATLTFLITIQAFLNLGVVSGLLPSKGMTLPFFSQGGSSLVMNIIALFLLLDLARERRA